MTAEGAKGRPLKVFLTGGTGFIGLRLVERLVGGGFEVVALTRSSSRKARLQELGCRIVEGDLSSSSELRDGMEGCDAAVHVAGDYRIGIPPSARSAMYETNVVGTKNVLSAAASTGLKKLVHVSTIAVFGNTHQSVVDEGFERRDRTFLSYYEETKWQAHELAAKAISEGGAVTIVLPGQVYGPNDHSEIGTVMSQAASGKLKFVPFVGTGYTLVHVDDAAEGISSVLQRGQIGESYILGGERTTMGSVIEAVAKLSNRKAPRLKPPTAILRLGIPFGPLVGKLLGFPPNLGELIRTSHAVTFWASDDKARSQLGYEPRSLALGLRQMLSSVGTKAEGS